MKKVGVIGTGTMGCGIAQVAAQIRCEVIFQNRKQESVNRGLARIQQGLAKLVAREKLTQAQCEGILSRIHGAESLEELKGCEIVIESAPEDLDLKQDLLEALSGIVSDRCILATNTSSLSVTKLASFVSRPERFIGMHFFNPVPLMGLVEVVRGLRTADSTVAAVREFAIALGKTPIEVKDLPGFAVNRVLFPMINEAAFALSEGVSDAEGIDACMKGGCNHPMGPLELADLVGLDVVHAILQSLHREYGDPRYAPCLEIVKRVEAGWLGRKTGRGFYDYGK
ncbi:MAG TPA: 3-hydroxyacyl-CoA dehydrogenase NAD-binding domain-containing protein [Myxococcota bacterium]|nr:3-hydroxyacyl-CoA dehydrogenase NAD-binding domain-containing protein [Myxococcota bacterium]